MTINDGGPARPLPIGMSLRDYFAAQALAGIVTAHLVATGPLFSLAEMAAVAYEAADAMIAEREKERT